MGFGLLYLLFVSTALTQSGIIRSAAKSPPPITFPARAVDAEIPNSLKKN